ncbi:metallophosphoesterase [Marinitoga litoralis]|uniref:metallophosphoesterase n=1 Tax=Marinitoga litoralis TaxID=570855 RepID=UPI0019621CF1|nr:metallophosphoesterase [Marinitoga litoralis]MBM7558507.1 putative MPP superfamily phosphohydrolase [Marinitoga litoralis]
MKLFRYVGYFFILILIYSFFLEPFSIKKSNLNIDIPEFESNIKIIHITDLHMYKYIFFHDKILNIIREEKPDIILYTGDSIIKNTDKDDLKKFFEELSKIAPVYVVYGNWDYYNLEMVNEVYNQKNIHIINNNTISIYFDDFSLKLIGLPIYKKIEYIDTTPASYTIALEHIPDTIFYNKEIFDQANLILAGHTHGGQVYIPFLTKYFIKKYSFYLRGKVNFNENKIMYINRGLGAWFNIRFLAPPEILIITLN